MSSSNDIILVFGATGAQGGSVIDTLLSWEKYKLRAVSRNDSSERSRYLSSRGVEMVRGDISQGLPDSIFHGVYGVFLVTDYWDPSCKGKEYELSVPIVDAAYSAGVKQFIFSSMVNCYEESNGKLQVAPFTDKAKVESYIRKKDFQYTAFPSPAFYYQNFQKFFPPKPDHSGDYSITFPATKFITGVDVTQIGGVVAAMFSYPEKFNGKFVPIAGDHQTPQYYVDAISEKIGKKVTHYFLSTAAFKKFDFEGAIEFAEMFRWFDRYGYYGKHSEWSWEDGRAIDPTLRNFKEYLDINEFKLS
jgi:uncharacterized protein YbjT (DUF2867 family)